MTGVVRRVGLLPSLRGVVIPGRHRCSLWFRLFGGYRGGYRLRRRGGWAGRGLRFGRGFRPGRGYIPLYPRFDAGVGADERLGGGLWFRSRSVRGRDLHRSVERDADGHHDGETEGDDHRPRPDLQEGIPPQIADEISEPHALPAAPEDRRRREASGDDIGKGAHAGLVCRRFGFLCAFYVDQGLHHLLSCVKGPGVSLPRSIIYCQGLWFYALEGET